MVYPRCRLDADALFALAVADLGGPLKAVLLLYATGDGRYWPTVKRYARACLPVSRDLDEAAYRLLRHASNKDRAKALRMREADYVAMIRPARDLLEQWLSLASERFLQALRGEVDLWKDDH